VGVQPRWSPGLPPELVVYDSPHPCPYLAGRDARLPMRMPSRALRPEELDGRLAAGDRRHGAFLYRPSCPTCAACEAIRIPVQRFTFSKNHRRVVNKARRRLRVQIGPPVADMRRLELYERHKRERSLLGASSEPLDLKGYEGFLVERCAPSFEMRYFDGDELVGVAITDRGHDALSAVYCFWDPSYASLSLGTWSILEQLRIAREWGYTYLYLGLYIAENAHMSYKARFRPHERLIDGTWQAFERQPGSAQQRNPVE